MPLRDKGLKGVKKTAVLAVFLGITLVIGFAERMIPLDIAVPGVRLGLSNVVILLLLYLFSPAEIIFVVILKCVLMSMFSGNFAAFAFSLSGSVLSFIVMSVLIKTTADRLSPVGVSALGAVSHNIGQIIAACYILGSTAIIAYLPVLLVAGVVTGVVTGIAVKYILKHINTVK